MFTINQIKDLIFTDYHIDVSTKLIHYTLKKIIYEKLKNNPFKIRIPENLTLKKVILLIKLLFCNYL